MPLIPPRPCPACHAHTVPPMANMTKSRPFVCPNCRAEVYSKWTFLAWIFYFEPVIWLILLAVLSMAFTLLRFMPPFAVFCVLAAGAAGWFLVFVMLWPLGVKKKHGLWGEAPDVRPTGRKAGSFPTRPS
ncbi:hypothetical protein [Nitrospirillum sp. BR 11828]|uniref:hypothetical protein n=1 Tax=Nitrospirillum sp. BR 11828 TaxID=3104325 RepID=UPI002ACA62CF|nr:hypothetical protein [Nitrospirillum sp. BR 11828]MDZ5648434.1 hypothetical protein [Nitrospirillum sp. BR 11828]